MAGHPIEPTREYGDACRRCITFRAVRANTPFAKGKVRNDRYGHKPAPVVSYRLQAYWDRN